MRARTIVTNDTYKKIFKKFSLKLKIKIICFISNLINKTLWLIISWKWNNEDNELEEEKAS